MVHVCNKEPGASRELVIAFAHVYTCVERLLMQGAGGAAADHVGCRQDTCRQVITSPISGPFCVELRHTVSHEEERLSLP